MPQKGAYGAWLYRKAAVQETYPLRCRRRHGLPLQKEWIEIMNIVKRSPGIMLIEQYGNRYIQYDAGQISDILLQIKINEDEFNRVQKEEITMESVVNYYDNRGLCSADELRNSLIKDYLRTVSDYSERKLSSIITKLIAHKDIYFEFYDFVLYEQFPKDVIVVEGLNAQQLTANYPLSPLGAYNYLIYLREMPEKALADLKAGLPTKDFFFI